MTAAGGARAGFLPGLRLRVSRSLKRGGSFSHSIALLYHDALSIGVVFILIVMNGKNLYSVHLSTEATAEQQEEIL